MGELGFQPGVSANSFPEPDPRLRISDQQLDVNPLRRILSRLCGYMDGRLGTHRLSQFILKRVDHGFRSGRTHRSFDDCPAGDVELAQAQYVSTSGATFTNRSRTSSPRRRRRSSWGRSNAPDHIQWEARRRVHSFRARFIIRAP